jgi:hypothetical protein
MQTPDQTELHTVKNQITERAFDLQPLRRKILKVALMIK